ncbi:MAG TPA: sigma-54-dependent Fis family transcriptional regulator [Candidatus Limnocylindria bacterium]|jgi:Nif-specific regulatory protein|nr:sigma-54-dependent Fis family transcriptional regulator [Candidatus Limnocylindria bacterium]
MVMAADDADQLARVQRERDLYRRLLDLGRQHEPEPFLREALGLIVEVAGARQGYLELHDDDDPEMPRWSLAHGFTAEQLAGVRAAISRGIIAEALASGKTVVTPSALLDERFRERESVRVGHIEAVLCAPIGDDPPRGVLYLQNCAGHGFFSEEDRACAETFARHLAPLVDRLLARWRERAGMDATAPVRARLRAPDVIGRSAALATALHHAALVAPLDVHVLLTGETGTGKSQVARLIHDNGPRAAHPFVTLNCAALPETLVESELFGALPGAHSTATRRIEGKVESAERGTLFLDEISELSHAAQAKLLHLLQAKEYYPLGGTRPLRANLRVIAATNIDLQQAVAERRFREDLFYRLQVLPIRVPSLAERREDIPLLAAHFCAQACARHGLPRLALSPNALRAAESAEWPGNVRQLENAVEAAVIRAAGAHAERVERAHLFPDSAARPEPDAPLTFQEATRRFQARLLQDALEAEGWNVVETARRLDLARSHVYNLIRAFGLERGRR